MEQLVESRTTENQNQHISQKLWELRNAVDQYLIERGVGHFCHVTVKRRDQWFEFCGQIDCQWSRAVLFGLVPPVNGKTYVIDKLKIVSAPTATGMMS